MTTTIGNRIVTVLLCIALAACGGEGASSPTANTATNGTSSITSGGTTVAGNSEQPASVVGGISTTEPASPDKTDGKKHSPAAQADPTQARFNRPSGITRDAAGNLYVADTFNNTVRKITLAGNVTTLAGLAGVSGHVDGTGATARFGFFEGITVDGAGNVYVLDNSTVRRITPAGVVTTIAGAPGESGDADGPGATARFNNPLFGGIAADSAGNVYVADTNNYLIRRVDKNGIVTTYAGTRGSRGIADGDAASATFLGPVGLAIDCSGNVFVADMFVPPAPNIPEGSTFIRRIATDGTVTTIAGNFRSETAPAQFESTHEITVDDAGNVYAINQDGIVRVKPSGKIRLVAAVSGDGITRDGEGNFYITSNSAIIRVAPDGSTTVIAGQPGQQGSIDVP